MKAYAISLIIFGIIIIIFPNILAYLLAGFLIYTGIILLIISFNIEKKDSGTIIGKFKIVKK